MYGRTAKFTEAEIALIVEFCTNPTLDDEIIMQRIANARMIETMNQASDGEMAASLFEGLSTGLGRVAILLRHKHALSGDAADGLAEAMARALDEIAVIMNLPL